MVRRANWPEDAVGMTMADAVSSWRTIHSHARRAILPAFAFLIAQRGATLSILEMPLPSLTVLSAI